MKKDINCLISGGAGFIGSHLSDALIAKGWRVYCLDNLITGSRKNIAHLINNPNFHFIEHDVTKFDTTTHTQKLPLISCLFHLASPASPPHYQKYSIETLLVNSYGTYNMLQLAKKFNAAFLLASTSEVYGDPLEHPQKEKYFGNVNPVGVRACYDEGKRFAEAITMEYVRKYNLDARIIRIFNTYGPRMQPSDGRVIVNFITQAISGQPLTVYSDGLQTRSFCYISDMVEGLITAMENKNTSGEVINMGFPEEHTVKEIAKIILRLTESSSGVTYYPKKEDDPVRRKPDISKAKKILGWSPKITLYKGLSKTIEYFSKKVSRDSRH